MSWHLSDPNWAKQILLNVLLIMVPNRQFADQRNGKKDLGYKQLEYIAYIWSALQISN